MLKKLSGVMAVAAIFWTGAASAYPYVYVPEAGAGTVTVVDAQTNTIVRTISNLNNAVGVAVNPNGIRAYISRGTDAEVSVLATDLISDPNQNPVIGRYAGQGDFHAVAVGRQGKVLYIGDTQND